MTTPIVQPGPLYRLSVKQYQQMVQHGILTKYDKVELIEGLMVERLPRNPPHNCAEDLLSVAVRPRLPDGWRLRNLLTVELTDSQVEPDFSAVRGPIRLHRDRHPTAEEVGLIVEVANTSLRFDRTDKHRIYAAVGIPTYWIVNLVDSRVEVYTQPSGPTELPAFGNLTTFAPGQAVPLVLDGVLVAAIPVADLLP